MGHHLPFWFHAMTTLTILFTQSAQLNAAERTLLPDRSARAKTQAP